MITQGTILVIIQAFRFWGIAVILEGRMSWALGFVYFS